MANKKSKEEFMNKDLRTIEFLKRETFILKAFSNRPKEVESIYDKLFETLDDIIQGQENIVFNEEHRENYA